MTERYVWRNGRFVDKATAEPMHVPERTGVVMPMVRSDIQPYASPIDGRMITTARERRDDLARNGCVPYEPMGNVPKGLNNPAFAKKHGRQDLLTEEARDAHKIPRKR